MNTYAPGATLRGSTSDTIYTVTKHVGTGGQAEVYAVETPDNRQLAAKLLHRECITQETLTQVDTLVASGSPSDAFVWPEERVVGLNCKAEGYVMPFCSGDRYVKPLDLLSGRFNPDFRTLCRYGLNISLAVSRVHARGQVYGDLSHLNLFFDRDGNVRFIDNDNIVTNHTPSGIVGTPPYMAPELFSFHTPHLTSPTILTDRYALGVLLYHLHVREHPLHGSRMLKDCRVMCRKTLMRWYGKTGRFVFDPSPNNDNPPDPNVHKHAIDNWIVLPNRLREKFIAGLGEGRFDPQSRPRVSEFIKLYADLPDSLFTCSNPSCGASNFSNNLQRQTCWKCHQEIRPRAYLQLSDGRRVCLSQGTQLFEHHLQPTTHRYRFETPLARVEKRDGSNDHGIRNHSNQVWYAFPSQRKALAVPPGRVVSLRRNLRINFGSIEAEVRATA